MLAMVQKIILDEVVKVFDKLALPLSSVWLTHDVLKQDFRSFSLLEILVCIFVLVVQAPLIRS